MVLYDINGKLEELSDAWEEFKSINERRLKEIEQKGSASSMTLSYLERLNERIDECKNSIVELENYAARPQLSSNSTSSPNLQFKRYLQNGEVKGNDTKNLSEKGEWPVRGPAFEYVSNAITQYAPIRQLASVDYIKSNTLKYVTDQGEFSNFTTWEDSFPNPKNPALHTVEIKVHDLKAKVQLHSKDLEDGILDIDKWLLDKMIINFAKAENKAFLYGKGPNQPAGIIPTLISSKEFKENIEYTRSITYESLLSLYFKLKSEYARDAVFLMHRNTLQSIRSIKLEGGAYIWQPQMDKTLTDTILGIPVYTTSDIDFYIPPEAGTLVPGEAEISIIILGDFKRGYKIVDRKEITIMRDPYTSAPYVNFLCTRRVGGGVINSEAFVMLSRDS